jgi:hypothetical protein
LLLPFPLYIGGWINKFFYEVTYLRDGKGNLIEDLTFLFYSQLVSGINLLVLHFDSYFGLGRC